MLGSKSVKHGKDGATDRVISRSTIFRIFDIGGTLLVAPLSLQPARWICYSAPNICSSLPAGLRADHASRQDGKWCNDLPRPRRRARLSLAAFLAVGGAGLLPARVTLSARRGARAVGGLARADRTTPTAGRAVLIRRQPDEQYLEALARRFAAAADLPLPMARRRVMALAISARPRPSSGFRIEPARPRGPSGPLPPSFLLLSCCQVVQRCACGNVTQVPGGNLRSGNTKSCGCGRRKTARDEHGRFLPTRKTSIQEKLAPRGSEPSAPRSHRIAL